MTGVNDMKYVKNNSKFNSFSSSVKFIHLLPWPKLKREKCVLLEVAQVFILKMSPFDKYDTALFLHLAAVVFHSIAVFSTTGGVFCVQNDCTL